MAEFWHIARPAVATDRLALTPQGYVRYTLKTPYRDGYTSYCTPSCLWMSSAICASSRARPSSGRRRHWCVGVIETLVLVVVSMGLDGTVSVPA